MIGRRYRRDGRVSSSGNSTRPGGGSVPRWAAEEARVASAPGSPSPPRPRPDGRGPRATAPARPPAARRRPPPGGRRRSPAASARACDTRHGAVPATRRAPPDHGRGTASRSTGCRREELRDFAWRLLGCRRGHRADRHGASRPWNLSTVPHVGRAPRRRSTVRAISATCALYGATDEDVGHLEPALASLPVDPAPADQRLDRCRDPGRLFGGAIAGPGMRQRNEADPRPTHRLAVATSWRAFAGSVSSRPS